MRRSFGNASAAQKARFVAIKESGCVVCRRYFDRLSMPEIHHLTSSGRAISHDHVVGLCSWHHRGVQEEGWSVAAMEAAFGPSYQRNKRAFTARFGDNETLLQIQQEILGT
ncbi:MAG: Ref family recombination enhancement nuclease [Silanimonas sp.]